MDLDRNPFAISGSKEVTAILELEAGQVYDLLVRYSYSPPTTQTSGVTARGGVRFGASPIKSSKEFIEEAVMVAKEVEAVVLLVGLNGGTRLFSPL